MICIDLMLPNRYELWSYNKNVDWYYSIFEVIILLLVFVVAFWHFDWESMYSLVILLIFLMAYVPANSGLSLSGQDLLYYFCVNLYFLFLFFVLDHIENKENQEEVMDTGDLGDYISEKGLTVLRILMITICIITIIYVYRYNGLDFSIFTSTMYETRANYAEYIAERSGTIISYFALILMGIVTWMLPLYLYISLDRVKIFDIVLAIITFLALFMMEMQKSTLMVIPLVLLVFICNKKNVKHSICNYVLWFFIILFCAILVEYFVRKGTSSIFDFLIPRMFYMPTYLNKIYYDYFSINSKIWFTRDAFPLSNILSRLIGQFGNYDIVTMISRGYFNGLIPSPNTGFFAEAFAQAGYLGILIFPPIIGALTKVMDKTAKWYGHGIELTIGARWALLLLNTQVLTTTRIIGIIMFVLITWFVRSQKSRNDVYIQRI